MNHLAKAIFASLLLAGGSTAMAQDSVTLYGIIDTAIGGAKQSYKHSGFGMMSGVQSGSRWGLRGQENLGNGLQLKFQLENGFNSATGERAQGGRMFGRAAWVGLAGEFGELRAGYQSLVGSEALQFLDPFGAGFNQAGMQSSFNGSSTNRANNVISYFSPVWEGLQAQVSYSFNWDGGAAQRRDSNQVLSTALLYNRGPLALGLTYETAWVGSQTAWGQRLSALNNNGKVRDPYTVQAGGSWDFGRITASAAWSYMKNGYTNPGMGDDYGATGMDIDFGTVRDFPGSHVNAYFLGLSMAVSPAVQVFGTWQMSDPSKDMFANRRAHDQQLYSIGATYTLSSSLNFYAFYSYADGAWSDKNWDSQNYGVGLRYRF